LEVTPDVARSVGRWGRVHVGEHLVWYLAAEAFKDRELFGLRQCRRRQFRINEETVRALVGAMKQRLIHPCEIKGIGKRLSHLAVTEDRPSRVEREGVHARWPAVSELGRRNPARFDRWQFSGIFPSRRVGLAADVVLAGVERLIGDIGISEKLLTDFVKVVLATIDGQVYSPTVRDADVGD
jgi:hypothetical protein